MASEFTKWIMIFWATAWLCAPTSIKADPSVSVVGGELLAVDPDTLPKVWRQVRGSWPSPWEVYPTTRVGNPPCIAIESSRTATSGRHAPACGFCVTVGFVVEPEGSTSSVRVLKAGPSQALARFVVADMRRWRFEPTSLNAKRQAAYSYATYVHVIGDTLTRDQMNSAVDEMNRVCAIDFP